MMSSKHSGSNGKKLEGTVDANDRVVFGGDAKEEGQCGALRHDGL